MKYLSLVALFSLTACGSRSNQQSSPESAVSATQGPAAYQSGTVRLCNTFIWVVGGEFTTTSCGGSGSVIAMQSGVVYQGCTGCEYYELDGVPYVVGIKTPAPVEP